jgi:diacylglycerol kinase (ATP)
LLELLRLRPISYRLTVDGRDREVQASLISIANNRFIGGGMMIAPDAKLDDGALQLFIVQPVSRLTFLRLFPKVFKGAHTELAVVSIERVIRVRMDAAVVAYADGERVAQLPVEVEVVAGALRMLC